MVRDRNLASVEARHHDLNQQVSATPVAGRQPHRPAARPAMAHGSGSPARAGTSAPAAADDCQFRFDMGKIGIV